MTNLIYNGRVQINGCLSQGVSDEGWLERSTRELFGVMAFYLDCDSGSMGVFGKFHGKFVSTHWSLSLKCV